MIYIDISLCAEMKEFYLLLHAESKEKNTQKAEIHQLLNS